MLRGLVPSRSSVLQRRVPRCDWEQATAQRQYSRDALSSCISYSVYGYECMAVLSPHLPTHPPTNRFDSMRPTLLRVAVPSHPPTGPFPRWRQDSAIHPHHSTWSHAMPGTASTVAAHAVSQHEAPQEHNIIQSELKYTRPISKPKVRPNSRGGQRKSALPQTLDKGSMAATSLGRPPSRCARDKLSLLPTGADEPGHWGPHRVVGLPCP